VAPAVRPVNVSPFSSENPVATTVPAELYKVTNIEAPGPVQLVLHHAVGFVQVVAKHGAQ
jgi:hypothetical protein